MFLYWPAYKSTYMKRKLWMLSRLFAIEMHIAYYWQQRSPFLTAFSSYFLQKGSHLHRHPVWHLKVTMELAALMNRSSKQDQKKITFFILWFRVPMRFLHKNIFIPGKYFCYRLWGRKTLFKVTTAYMLGQPIRYGILWLYT